MKALVLTLALLALLSSVALAAPQTPDSCDNTGRYCFADTLYDCVDGHPQPVKTCDKCENGECVSAPLAPNVSESTPPAPVQAGPDDTIKYAATGAVVLAIILLFLRIKTRK